MKFATKLIGSNKVEFIDIRVAASQDTMIHQTRNVGETVAACGATEGFMADPMHKERVSCEECIATFTSERLKR